MIENQIVRAITQPARRAAGAGSARAADEAVTLASENTLDRAGHYAGSWVDRLMARHPTLNRFYNWIYGALSHPANTPIVGNLGQLDRNLLRGEQPGALGFAALRKDGVGAVVNLRREEDWERKLVVQNGMKSYRIGLPGLGAPSDRDGIRFLTLVTDPATVSDAAHPKVFFHCEHGADRTGAMAAIYRIAAQGWSVDAAISEMAKFHFHQGFEDANEEFVRRFARYWQTLPQVTQDKVLHRVAPRSV